MTSAGIQSQTIDTRHQALFYSDDLELVRELESFVGDVLVDRGTAIVLGTEKHLHSLLAVLPAAQVASALADGRLVLMDAQHTLELFMRNGHPVPELFDQAVGALVRAHRPAVGTMRIYGEMVSVLTAGGHLDSAMELEDLWGELLDQIPCELLCSYPLEYAFARDGDAPTQIANRHSSVRMTPINSALDIFRVPAR